MSIFTCDYFLAFGSGQLSSAMTSQMDKTKAEIDLSCNALCLYVERNLRLDQQNSKFLDPFESLH